MSLHTGTVSRPRTHVAEPQRAALRQHIHGRIIGIPDRRDWSAPIFIALALVIAAFFALQLARPLLKAASSASPLAEGSTLHLNDARMEKGQDHGN